MKVLLDECVPRKVSRFLTGHEVLTVQEMNWHAIRNGKLLSAAEAAAFDVLVTCDKNLQYQQKVLGRSLGIVQLPTNRLAALEKISQRIRESVEATSSGSFHELKL